MRCVSVLYVWLPDISREIRNPIVPQVTCKVATCVRYESTHKVSHAKQSKSATIVNNSFAFCPKWILNDDVHSPMTYHKWSLLLQILLPRFPALASLSCVLLFLITTRCQGFLARSSLLVSFLTSFLQLFGDAPAWVVSSQSSTNTNSYLLTFP